MKLSQKHRRRTAWIHNVYGHSFAQILGTYEIIQYLYLLLSIHILVYIVIVFILICVPLLSERIYVISNIQECEIFYLVSNDDHYIL